MQDYEQVCKHVGKIVLDFKFHEEKLVRQAQEAMESFKQTLDEKNKRIKELEEALKKQEK